ncbi:MAG: agmatine deiminase family protein [Marivirga sp.]|nr:agmatine deiminase family protein [Marivirga sp.]
MPAEWEPHEAVWLGWEDDLLEYHPPIVKLIHALTPHVNVKIAVASDSLLQVARKYLYEHQVDTNKVKFYLMPGDRYWIRDHGASFLVNSRGELGVANFAWNAYGYPGWLNIKYNGDPDSVKKHLNKALPKMKNTGAVDSLMAIEEGATILNTDVIHEGGAIEVNGKGTLILCEATVFQRNPDRNKQDLEKEFKRVLGVSKIIWMKKGLADDPLHFFRRITGNYVGGGTGGHTDEFVRFANPNTILLAWVDDEEKDLNPINRMNYDRMNENLKILEQSQDQDGKPFQIIKVPLPDLIVKKVNVRDNIGKAEITLDISRSDFALSEAPQKKDSLLRVPASSYMNYLVTNGIIVLPTYTHMGSSEEKQERVRKIFQEQFPGRELIFIDAMPQNWAGGGIHCSTQQLPSHK